MIKIFYEIYEVNPKIKHIGEIPQKPIKIINLKEHFAVGWIRDNGVKSLGYMIQEHKIDYKNSSFIISTNSFKPTHRELDIYFYKDAGWTKTKIYFSRKGNVKE